MSTEVVADHLWFTHKFKHEFSRIKQQSGSLFMGFYEQCQFGNLIEQRIRLLGGDPDELKVARQQDTAALQLG